jgi:hypothetical protein
VDSGIADRSITCLPYSRFKLALSAVTLQPTITVPIVNIAPPSFSLTFFFVACQPSCCLSLLPLINPNYLPVAHDTSPFRPAKVSAQASRLKHVYPVAWEVDCRLRINALKHSAHYIVTVSFLLPPPPPARSRASVEVFHRFTTFT